MFQGSGAVPAPAHPPGPRPVSDGPGAPGQGPGTGSSRPALAGRGLAERSPGRPPGCRAGGTAVPERHREDLRPRAPDIPWYGARPALRRKEYADRGVRGSAAALRHPGGILSGNDCARIGLPPGRDASAAIRRPASARREMAGAAGTAVAGTPGASGGPAAGEGRERQSPGNRSGTSGRTGRGPGRGVRPRAAAARSTAVRRGSRSRSSPSTPEPDGWIQQFTTRPVFEQSGRITIAAAAGTLRRHR